jgi:[protein-PII] uridylyltransferase
MTIANLPGMETSDVGVIMSQPSERTNAEKKTRQDRVQHASNQHRALLYGTMLGAVGDMIGKEELAVHFTHMPTRYWARVDKETLHGHLEIIHAFLDSLRESDVDGTRPVVRWRHSPDRGVTAVEVCTWDRLGLLAKVAGAFAAVGLNIVRADIFTRADNVVLDIFEVCNGDEGCVRDESRLEKMVRLLEMALKPPASDAAPVELFTFVPPVGSRRRTLTTPPLVTFDPTRTDAHTVLVVETQDEIGLLYRILSALAAEDVNCAHAIITTEAGRVGDVFFLTDTEGRKITDTLRLEQIRQRVLESIS